MRRLYSFRALVTLVDCTFPDEMPFPISFPMLLGCLDLVVRYRNLSGFDASIKYAVISEESDS